MFNIEGYSEIEFLTQTQYSEIYWARDERDDCKVVLKKLRSAFPSFLELSRFELEYSIGRQFFHPSIVKTRKLISKGSQRILVFDSLGPETSTLYDHVSNGGLEYSEFLNIAQKITKGLRMIHQHGVIHRDLNPKNIIYRKKNGKLQIIDFGLAIYFQKEFSITPLRAPSAKSSYVAPEQSGKINYSVDFRSDLYSLGVILFFVATGKLPFKNENPLDLLHSHLALIPPNICDLRPNFPKVVADLVSRLLEKIPENRYQSADAFLYDLNRLNDVSKFKIGGRIFPAILPIPQKIYGRDEELNNVQNILVTGNRAGSLLLRVVGPAGIGKTKLVNEVYRNLLEKEYLFGVGKFDKFTQNIPYFALRQAMKEIISHTLIQPKDTLEKICKRLREYIGTTAASLLSVIPEIELLIGPQPKIENLTPLENQNRFNILFVRFLEVLNDHEGPIILILDGMQWCDLPTLNLLEVIARNPSLINLRVVLIYRDDEMEAKHPLFVLINKLTELKVSLPLIKLKSIKVPDISKLLGDSFNRSPEVCQKISKKIFVRTGGNPFFIRQFLEAIYDQRYIWFDAEFEAWDFDEKKIDSFKTMDDVTSLITDRLYLFNPDTVKILQTAVLIGSHFSLNLLAKATGRSEARISCLLQPAIFGNLINILSNKIIRTDQVLSKNKNKAFKNNSFNIQYSFSHDWVREAVYSMIPKSELSNKHLKLARFLHKHYKKAKPTLKVPLIEIGRHYNKAQNLFDKFKDRKILFDVNLRAGKLAKEYFAFDIARDHFQTALKTLNDADWETHYSDLFECNLSLAECEYLIGNLDKGDSILCLLESKTNSMLDRIHLTRRIIAVYMNLDRYEGGINICLKNLKLLGVKLNPHIKSIQIIKELSSIIILKGRRTPEDLLNLPTMKDPIFLETMQILVDLFVIAFIKNNRNLAIFSLLAMVKLSLKHGNTSLSALAYVSYGITLGVSWGYYREGKKFGDLGIQLLSKYPSIAVESKTKFFYANCQYWLSPGSKSDFNFKGAYFASLNSGDIVHSGWSIIFYLDYCLYQGDHPHSILSELESFQTFFEAFGRAAQMATITLIKQSQLCVLDHTESRLSYSDSFFSEKEIIDKYEKMNFQQGCCFYAVHKIRNYIDYQEYDKSWELLKKFNHAFRSLIPAQYIIDKEFLHIFLLLHRLNSKINLNLFEKFVIYKKLKYLEKWETISPFNISHKIALLKGIKAGYKGDYELAEKKFSQALEFAQKNGFEKDAGLIAEQFSLYYQRRKLVKLADLTIQEAHYFYSIAGYTAKKRDIEERYSFVKSENKKIESKPTYSSKVEINSLFSFLNTDSIFQLSQSIPEEMHFSALIKKILTTVVVSTDATRAVLILVENDHFFVHSVFNSDENEVLETLLPIEKATSLIPEEMITLAMKSQKSIIVDRPAKDVQFYESYFMTIDPGAVACFPLLYKGDLVGSFYLENELTEGAFTETRIRTLNLLSKSISLALRNAQLYQSLDYKIQLRTQELQEERNKLDEKNKFITREMNLARKLLQQLLPQKSPCPEISFINFPARDIGGDYFDFFPLKNNRIGIFISDASGHGISLALISSMVKATILQARDFFENPAKLLDYINNVLVGRTANNFVTALYGILDHSSGEFRFAVAGHPAPILIENQSIELLNPIAGPPLAVCTQKELKSLGKEYQENQIFIPPNEKLLLYTDGLTEAKSKFDNEQFDECQLQVSLIQHSQKKPEKLISNLVNDLKHFRGNDNYEDDICIICVENFKEN